MQGDKSISKMVFTDARLVLAVKMTLMSIRQMCKCVVLQWTMY